MNAPESKSEFIPIRLDGIFVQAWRGGIQNNNSNNSNNNKGKTATFAFSYMPYVATGQLISIYAHGLCLIDPSIIGKVNPIPFGIFSTYGSSAPNTLVN